MFSFVIISTEGQVSPEPLHDISSSLGKPIAISQEDLSHSEEPDHEKLEPEPGSYYYDDATGYEIYDPKSDDDDEGDVSEEKSLASPSYSWRTSFQ